MDLRFSDDFLKVLEFSRDEALRTGWHNITADHVMLGILRHSESSACAALARLGIAPEELKTGIDGALFATEPVSWEARHSVNLSEGAVSLLQQASLEALRCGGASVEPLHFLLAVCRTAGSYTNGWLAGHGITLRSLVEASGLPWESYGLEHHPAPAGVQPAMPDLSPITSGPSAVMSDTSAVMPDLIGHLPDPHLMAEAIEQRLREGYTTDNPHVS